jgi:CRP-like cAMP-binding protein
VVFRQGDEGSSIHIVTEGRFAMEIESPVGSAVTLAVFTPGDSFGNITHLSGEPFRFSTVVALEQGETLMIPGGRFAEIRQELPEIDRALCAMLAGRLRAAHERVVQLAEVPAPRRVLEALLRLAGLYRSAEGPVTISLSQRRLAGIAGTSRDTVNRVLARGEREGWLLVGREKVVVLDLPRLADRLR